MGYFTDRLEQEKEGEAPLPGAIPPEPVQSAPAPAPLTGKTPGDFFSQKLKEHLGEKQEATQQAEQSKITADTPWSEVLTEGAKNFIPDIGTTAWDIGQGLSRAVMHPVETGKGLSALAKGTYDYFADNKTPEREVATDLGNELYKDYFTEEGWKKGIGERPFARALDVGTAMLAPEYLAGKAGATGLAKGLSYANPATWIEKGVAKAIDIPTHAATELAGEMGTHTGGWSIALGRQAAKESPEMAAAYKAGQKSKASLGDMVNGFEQAMDEVKAVGHKEYRADKNALKQDSQRMSLQTVEDAIKQSERDFIDPFSTTPNPEVVAALNEIKDLVARHREAALNFDFTQTMNRNRLMGTRGHQVGPNPHLDPLGMDELKKAIGRVVGKNNGEAEAAAARIYAALGNQIKTAAPIYDRMMGRYAAMHDALQSFKKELSLGTNNPDAALKKLFSSLRSNVVTSFGRRRKLVQELAKMSPAARKSLYTLAGQYNSAWFPRGLVGQFKMGAAPFVGYASAPWLFSHPAALFGLGTQSPRIMGTMARWQGGIERRLGKIPWRGLFAPAAEYGAHYGSMPPWYAVNPALDKAEEISPFWMGRYSPYAHAALQSMGIEDE